MRGCCQFVASAKGLSRAAAAAAAATNVMSIQLQKEIGNTHATHTHTPTHSSVVCCILASCRDVSLTWDQWQRTTGRRSLFPLFPSPPPTSSVEALTVGNFAIVENYFSQICCLSSSSLSSFWCVLTAKSIGSKIMLQKRSNSSSSH